LHEEKEYFFLFLDSSWIESEFSSPRVLANTVHGVIPYSKRNRIFSNQYAEGKSLPENISGGIGKEIGHVFF
jgi:hypothetical protein